MSSIGRSTAGVSFPETKVARAATELVRDLTTELVYHHSRRVFTAGRPSEMP